MALCDLKKNTGDARTPPAKDNKEKEEGGDLSVSW
jgi:hypothetical protein